MGRQHARKPRQATASVTAVTTTDTFDDLLGHVDSDPAMRNRLANAILPLIASALTEDKTFCYNVLKCALKVPEAKLVLFELVSQEQREHEVCC
jgi:hypothetical protein